MSPVRTKSGLCYIWLTVMLVAGLSGCSGDGGTTVEPGPIVTVFITPDGATLAQVGESIQLQATTLDAVGRIVNSALITWHQLAGGDVASIDADGLVTATGHGSAQFAATVGTGPDSPADSVYVSIELVPAVVVFSPEAMSVPTGWTAQLIPTVRDADGHEIPDEPLTWQSSDTDIAPVDTTGYVTGLAPGPVTITATTSNGADGSIILDVYQHAARLLIFPTVVLITIDETVQFTATVLDDIFAVIPDVTIEWSCIPTIATVDTNGLATGVGYGTTSVGAVAEAGGGSVANSARLTVQLLNKSGDQR